MADESKPNKLRTGVFWFVSCVTVALMGIMLYLAWPGISGAVGN